MFRLAESVTFSFCLGCELSFTNLKQWVNINNMGAMYVMGVMYFVWFDYETLEAD